MRAFSTLAFLVATALARYTCVDDYTKGTFADQFQFFTGNDPTNGYVNYVDRQTATSSGLYRQNSDNVYIGVDHNNTASGRGRNSVRIASNKSYQHALIILDLAHMPGGACGTWPAFWLLSTSAEWPNGGEVDIIEGVNGQTYNNMALHTNAGCSISSNAQSMSSQVVTDNCNINAPNQATNQGCSIKTSRTDTYGSGFNANGGGVYATEWTSNGISIWYFPRNSIPSDLSSGSPSPSTWGTPLSRFAGDCNWDQKIVNQQIIFDVTFCGDWAGNVFSSDATCGSKASSCQAYVKNNPSAFTDTYWSINSLKVYQDNGAAAKITKTSSLNTVSSTSTTISTVTRSSTTSLPATSVVITTFVTVTAPGSSTTISSSTVLSSSSTTLPSTTTTIPTISSTTSPTTIIYTTSLTTTSLATTISSYTTPSTTTIPTTFSTISYPPKPGSSWTLWTMGFSQGAPSASQATTMNVLPTTFSTVTRPWSGGPSGNWGPPSYSISGGWNGPGGPGGHGPGGPGGWNAPPKV